MRCFVAMPFKAPFQTRFADVFKPAIEALHLDAYKVDLDDHADKLVEDIERGISEAAIVLVDITLDNPNVWYELGFAHASKKPVVIVACKSERRGRKKYPFDVSTRRIIEYTNDGPSAYRKLQERITAAIRARLEDAGIKLPEPPPPPSKPVAVTIHAPSYTKSDPPLSPTARDYLGPARQAGAVQIPTSHVRTALDYMGDASLGGRALAAREELQRTLGVDGLVGKTAAHAYDAVRAATLPDAADEGAARALEILRKELGGLPPELPNPDLDRHMDALYQEYTNTVEQFVEVTRKASEEPTKGRPGRKLPDT